MNQDLEVYVFQAGRLAGQGFGLRPVALEQFDALLLQFTGIGLLQLGAERLFGITPSMPAAAVGLRLVSGIINLGVLWPYRVYVDEDERRTDPLVQAFGRPRAGYVRYPELGDDGPRLFRAILQLSGALPGTAWDLFAQAVGTVQGASTSAPETGPGLVPTIRLEICAAPSRATRVSH